MKMEQTECSETSAYKIQMLENYPEGSIQHTKHGESLKSRILLDCVTVKMTALQSFKMWGTTCLVTQQHIPEDVNVHHHRCALRAVCTSNLAASTFYETVYPSPSLWYLYLFRLFLHNHSPLCKDTCLSS